MPLELPSYVAGQARAHGRFVACALPLGRFVDRIGSSDQDDASRSSHRGGAGRTAGKLESLRAARNFRRAAAALAARRDEFAELIRLEAGLCVRETRYETGRSSDVLEFAAIEALRDDGQVFSCDVSPQGKPRKIFTFRQPLQLVSAITPFNHPLNQVVHKLAPAVAAGVPVLLKPSEKTPLTAIRFTELLYEAGLPGWMLSTFVGDLQDVVHQMIVDERVELVTFTGSVAVGHEIARQAGYKKLCLELGGNSPLIVLEDADLELATRLAAEGSFRNSGQRCTAVKRILVQRSILDDFTERFVELAREYVAGDPADPQVRVGTVIDQQAAAVLEAARATSGRGWRSRPVGGAAPRSADGTHRRG